MNYIDAEIVKGTKKYKISNNELTGTSLEVLSFIVGKVKKRNYFSSIDGRVGRVNYGIEDEYRTIKLTLRTNAYDEHDISHLRDEIFNLFDGEFYIREMRNNMTTVKYETIGSNTDDMNLGNSEYVNGKRYLVALVSDFDIADMQYSEFNLEFETIALPFAETTYTTLDLHDNRFNSDVEMFGYVDGINVEHINYRVKKEDLNLLSSTDLSVVNAIKSTNNYLVDGTVTFEVANNVSGIAIKGTSLKPNTSYTLKYDYQKVRGTLVGFGGHMDATWANAFTSGRVDNKAIINYQGVTSAYIADDNNKHTVILHFKTGETVDITHNIYIQPNRLKSDQVEVKVSNLTLVEGDSETQNWSHSILDFSKVANPKITSQKFSIYNAGNVTVEPEGMMYLKTFIMGLTTNDKPFIIRNKTTNEEFILNKAGVGNNLLIDGLNVTLNNVNVLRDTNFNFIKLESGLNEFEIIGGIYSGLYFDFRFYYK